MGFMQLNTPSIELPDHHPAALSAEIDSQMSGW
jgi:hypothetical protein